MIIHTITPLPNGNFLWKLVAEGETVQTTEIPQSAADHIAHEILGKLGYKIIDPHEEAE